MSEPEELTPQVTTEVFFNGILERDYPRLITLSQEQILALWHWRWNEKESVEMNIYGFCEALALYKRCYTQWEIHHNGVSGVVGRVRDWYLMPRIREFQAEINKHAEGK